MTARGFEFGRLICLAALSVWVTMVASLRLDAGEPVARWVADDWSGGTANWVDRVGGKIATSYGSPVKATTQFGGSASSSGIVFDGVDDYFEVASDQNPIAGQNRVTIVALFKATQGATGTDGNHWQYPGPINAEAGGEPNDFGLSVSQDGYANAFFNGAISPSLPVSVVDGAVHTMMLTWSDAFGGGDETARFYVDGVLKGSLISDNGNGIVTSRFRFGRDMEDQRWFLGTVGELRFYASIEDPAALHASMSNVVPTLGFLSTTEAAGGDVVPISDSNIHTFRQSGSFVPPTSGTVEVLVVGGGGGGGGSFAGGGGGGGGVVSSTSYAVNAGEPIPVIVGLGGAGGSHSLQGENGGLSQFGSLTALGGGGGGTYPGIGSGRNGGSGGGAGYAGVPGAGQVGQGLLGGAFGTSPSNHGGGGGGAGGTPVSSGIGGVGIVSSISGLASYYAGGGAAGTDDSVPLAGGLGGGGVGGQGLVNGLNGVANTGGGGGGGGGLSTVPVGGSGGSGVVIVRYSSFRTLSVMGSATQSSFSTISGSVSGTDPDPNTTLVYGIIGGEWTATAVQVSKTGSFGTLTLNTATGAYSFAPLAAGINSLQTSASEGYTLTVTDGVATASVGLTVNILVEQLALTTQPAGVISGAIITSPPVVEIRDSKGIRTASTGAVSVSIDSGTGGALSGTLSVNAVNGVATFSDLTMTGTLNTSYTLKFNSSGYKASSTRGQVEWAYVVRNGLGVGRSQLYIDMRQFTGTGINPNQVNTIQLLGLYSGSVSWISTDPNSWSTFEIPSALSNIPGIAISYYSGSPEDSGVRLMRLGEESYGIQANFSFALPFTSTTSAAFTVNLPPTLAAIGVSGTEDIPLTFSSVNFSSGFTDPEGASLASIQIVSPPATGVLSLVGSAVSAAQVIPFSQLSSLTYTPAANENGAKTFTVKASDGSAWSSVATVTMTLAPVNDAPTVIAPASVAMTEDNAGNLIYTGTPFADIDSSILTVTLSVSDGTITGNAGTGITVWGTAIARIFSGTVSDLNTYFTTAGKITYQGTLNNTENRTLTTTVSDGADTTVPPVSGYARWFDASTLNLANGASVVLWPDGSGSGYDAIKLSDRQAPKFVSDAGTGTGLGAVSFTAGVKNLDGKSTVLDQALDFTRDTAIRSVFSVFKGSSFLLTDSGGDRYDFHRPSDDNPNDPLWVDLRANLSNPFITAGNTYVNQVLVDGSTFSMPTEARNGFNLVSVLTTGPVSADSFNRDRIFHSGIQSHAEVILYDRVLTDAERVLVENYLSAKWFGPGRRASVTSTVSFTPVSDTPVVVAGGSFNYTENAAAGVMSGTVTVSDVDSLQITGATVTISAGLTSGDVLGFTTQNGITGNYATSTGVLTLSGASTVENYQTALRSVTYWSTSENPTANSASRTVSWQVIDANSASSVAVTSTISITAVNDAPMLTSVDLLTGGIEDMDYTITYEALAATGNESDLDNSSILFRIGTVSSGSLTKNGVAVTPGSTLLAAGESVVWRPAVNANGVLEAFTVTAWDGQSASSTAVPVQISVTAAPHGLGSELLVNPGFELRESSNSLYPLGWNSTVGFVVFTGSRGEYGPPSITTGGQLAFGYSSSVVVSQTAGLGTLGIAEVSEFQLEYLLARNQQAGIYWVQVEFLSASGQVLAQRRQPSSGTAAAPSTWTTETVRFNRGEIAEFDQITQVRVSLFGQQSPLIWAGHYGPFFDYVSLKPSLRTPLAVSGITALGKVYDATTSAELNTAGANLVGVVSGDSVNLSAVGAVGVFSSPTVGATKAVTVSGLTLSGNQAWKYSLVPPAGLTAAITAKTLTVSGLSGVNKSYDRTTAATVSGSAALSGVISSDTVTLGGTPVFSFASANVGAGIAITTTGYTLSGDQALNYSLTQPSGLTGTITAKALSIGAPTIASKLYDGTTAAGAVTVGSLSGTVSPETLAVTGTAAAYSSAAVGTYQNVVVTYTLANGNGNTAGLASNYSLSPGSATGTITPRELVITVDPVSLMSDFDGQSHGVLWTTTPAGISVEVLYNGSTTIPKAAGSYSVTLSSADARFSARLEVTLVIRKSVQGITLNSAVVAAGLQTVSDASGRYLLQATLGQPIAGPASAVSGMQLNSGFWFTEQFSAALDGRNLVGAKLESKIRASVILRGASIDAPEATVMGPEMSRLALGIPPSTRLTVLPVAGSGEVWIRVSGVPSGRWLIQYQDRLHSNEWLDEGLVELDGDGLGAVRAATGVGEMRFYRLVQQ